MDIKEVGGKNMDLTDLVQDTDRWWAVVKAVMNFRVSSNAGNCSLSEYFLAS